MDLNQYLKELEYLVNIDSCSDDAEGVTKVADFFVEKFNEMGWNVHEYEFGGACGKCVICTNREAEHYDLLLMGHLDTVFPKGTCSERPFKIDGELAYGPGVCDMKHGSLLMYHILKELPDEINEKLNIVAVFNPDEEISSIYSEDVYKEYAKKSDYGFVYEASGECGCCAERKGGFFGTVEFTGKDGHSGYMFTNGSKSAVHEMGKWIVEFSEMASPEKNTTVNIGVANGGFKRNIVAPKANMTLDIRFSDNDEIQRFNRKIEEMTKGAKERGISVKVVEKISTDALVYTERVDAYIKHIEKITSENGFEFKHRARGGLSDANKLASYGVLCIDGMGPTGGCDHTPDEFMAIESVIPYYNLSAILIKDLADSK